MTLIPCPECRRAVSSAAFQCPGCGQPLRAEEARRPRGRDPVLPLVLAGALLASALGYAGVWTAAARFHEAREGWRVEVIRTFDMPPLPPAPVMVTSEPPVAVMPGELDVLPEIENGAEVSRMIARIYPPMLRDAGIPGTAVVRFRVLEDGSPDLSSLAVERASHDAFGDAAPRVVGRMRFRPGMIGGRAVATWMTIPISFDPSR